MKEILTMCKALLENCYAPYSKFKVSAVLLLKDGKTIGGVNVENASYGATICAERNAINAALTKGYKKEDFASLTIMANSDNIVRPCSICRQTFVEFFNEDFIIHMSNQNLEYESLTLKDLVPFPFMEVK